MHSDLQQPYCLSLPGIAGVVAAIVAATCVITGTAATSIAAVADTVTVTVTQLPGFLPLPPLPLALAFALLLLCLLLFLALLLVPLALLLELAPRALAVLGSRAALLLPVWADRRLDRLKAPLLAPCAQACLRRTRRSALTLEWTTTHS